MSGYPVVWVEQAGPYTAGENVTVVGYVDGNPPGQNDDGDATTFNQWGYFYNNATLSDNATSLGAYSSLSSYSIYDSETCYVNPLDPNSATYPCEVEVTFNLFEWNVLLSPGAHTFTMYWGGGEAYTCQYNWSGNVWWVPSSGNTSLSVPLASPSLSVSASPNSFNYGSNTTITASLSGGYNPTGTVTFYLDGSPVGSAGVSGSTATLSVGSSWAVGNHTITASYPGDSNNNSASAGGYGVTVNKASSSVVVSSTANPSTYGGSVTFTATVTSGATGTVTFKDGATTLGSGTISGTTATYTTSALTGGSHSITAVYGGDGNFTGSTSGVSTQTVNTAPVTVSLSSTKNPSTFDDSITITITLTGSGVVPTGTVTLKDSATTLATPTLDGTAKVTYTTSSLLAGTHSLVATYNGDSNYH